MSHFEAQRLRSRGLLEASDFAILLKLANDMDRVGWIRLKDTTILGLGSQKILIFFNQKSESRASL